MCSLTNRDNEEARQLIKELAIKKLFSPGSTLIGTTFSKTEAGYIIKLVLHNDIKFVHTL
jgi:hypothetical protein